MRVSYPEGSPLQNYEIVAIDNNHPKILVKVQEGYLVYLTDAWILDDIKSGKCKIEYQREYILKAIKRYEQTRRD